MQSTKGRASPKDSPQKVSTRPARQLKINADHSSPSPSKHVTAKISKDGSPKVTERRSPRSPIIEKKRTSKLSELESQISKLQEDLITVKDQLISSEAAKSEAQTDAEDVKRQLACVSLKLEESQKQLSEHAASQNTSVVDLNSVSQEEEQEWNSRIEAIREQHSVDSASLALALDESQRLKLQLEKASEPEDPQRQLSELSQAEIQSLKNSLLEYTSVLESMKYELVQCKESKAQAEKVVKETLDQLEAAKETIHALRSNVVSSRDAYNSVAYDLQQSRAQVSFLEDFVNNLKKVNNVSSDPECNQNLPEDEPIKQGMMGADELQMELQSTKSEVRQLKSALQAAEIRFNEEQSHSCLQVNSAFELREQIKAHSSAKEAELAEELKKANATIDELRAHLMDKETELQGISEENANLNMKLEKSVSGHREKELQVELKQLMQVVAGMKGSLLDKETELQNVLEENEMLKLEISERETHKGVEVDQIAAEVDASKAAEQEAMTNLGYMMEEVDKSNRKISRVVEQLEAAQAANADMEAELRKLKVQSDQWRKAAEAAASMLSPGSNGKYVERTGSMPKDGKYSPVGGRITSPYLDDYDDDSFKKKNGNVLKKIGVLWKKPQK